MKMDIYKCPFLKNPLENFRENCDFFHSKHNALNPDFLISGPQHNFFYIFIEKRV